MPSVSNQFGEGGGPSLLKGSDVVKAKKKAVGIVVESVRRSPAGFGAPLIIDFDSEPIPGKVSWACNLTETRKLAHMIDDDYDKWIGWGIVLQLTAKNNPQTKTTVDSLEVAAVRSPDEVAKTRKSKPKPAKPASAKGKGVTDDEVPF